MRKRENLENPSDKLIALWRGYEALIVSIDMLHPGVSTKAEDAIVYSLDRQADRLLIRIKKLGGEDVRSKMFDWDCR